MQVLFWVSFGILAYIFLGYPALVVALSTIVERVSAARRTGEVDTKGEDELPTVTLIIAAYNEAKVIKDKIFNTFELDYPKNKLQVIVFSDASTDHTDAIVKSFGPRGIEFIRVEGRVGKTECQNQVINHAAGDVVVFSDANSMYDAQAIKNLVKHFTDKKIGCVVGELRYVKNGKSDENLYWRFEQMLKKTESTINSCLGANGSIYAIRKNLYIPLAKDAISDFIEPFKIYKQGFRVVYESNAFCLEVVGENKTEFGRKRRIIARAFSSLKYIQSFLNPFKYGFYSLMLWSHKILRWFPLVFMGALLIATSFLLSHMFFAIVFALQIMFYGCAVIGMISSKKPFSIAYLFMVMHISALLGVLDTLMGKRVTSWKTVR